MNMELKIHSVGFAVDGKLKEHIAEKLEKKLKYNNRVVSNDVYLKLENTGQIKEKIVEIKTQIPGNTVFVADSHKTFEGAFDKSFEALKRQLKKYNERLKAKRS